MDDKSNYNILGVVYYMGGIYKYSRLFSSMLSLIGSGRVPPGR